MTQRKITSANSANRRYILNACPLNSAIELIRGRWKSPILFQIGKGDNHFSLLRKALPSISQKMLGEKLEELRRDELIYKVVLSEKPLSVKYDLTPKGQSLLIVLAQLNDWGRDWIPGNYQKTGCSLAS